MLAIAFFATTAHADLLDVPWKAVPATGVEMKLSRDRGRTDDDALRVDFDFHGHGGYAISRREGAVDLPENFELSFWMKANAPRNTLEVKLIDESGENVWWSVRRELDFPREWKRFSIRKRQFEFAWGPAGNSPLPKRIGAIEIVVTAGTGGAGTVWIDDVNIAPLDTAPPGPLPHLTNLPWRGTAGFTADLGKRYEIGGMAIDWDEAPSRYDVALSIDGKEWETVRRVESTNGARDWIYLPDGDARFVRLNFDRAAIRDITLLEPLRTPNDFFTAVAKPSQRGDYPRYLYGEQRYWTIVGGRNGEQSEALLSEDGAIEAGDSRVSIEPFLMIDGKLVTWNDVTVEQVTGPSVVWKKHLTITPRMEANTLAVHYVAAPNATLYLAVRPFQVNPPWQFLKRTGGTVKITRIAREGNTITADGDQRATIIAEPATFGATTFDGGEIIEHLRAGTLPDAQSVTDEFGYASAAMRFDTHDVTIRIPLGPASTTPPVRDSKWTIDVPAEPRIADSIRANVEYILINRDGPAIHPGSRSYERSWIRDGSLTSAALLRLGYDDVVRQFIDYYAQYVAPNGYVPCCVSSAGADPVPEHDSHGEFIFLVAEYYRHTHDRELVARMWPVVQRVVGYIDELRHERMTPKYQGTVFYGLVPESISHEGYSAKAMHSYWDDFFVLRGLEDAAFLAREVAGVRAGVSASGARVARADSSTALRRASGAAPPARNDKRSATIDRHPEKDESLVIPSRRSSQGERRTVEESVLATRSRAGESLVIPSRRSSQSERRTVEESVLATRSRAGESLVIPSRRSSQSERRTVEESDLATNPDRYEKLAEDFRHDLLASIALTMKQHAIDYIPGSAELGDFDATSTTIAVSPVAAEAYLPEKALRNTFDRYWQHALEPRTYTPYELRIVGTLVRLGQPERARRLLEYFFEDQTPQPWHQWAEVVHRDPREPAFLGDLPHTWVGSDFIRSALDFFAYEREADDALVLGAGVDPQWLAEGVKVSGLSTRYGALEYSLKKEGDAMRVRIAEGVTIPRGGVVVVSPWNGHETVIRRLPANVLIRR